MGSRSQILGFFPVWVLGVVDYHGSRLVALEPLAWPGAAAVTNAMESAFENDGTPERILTDRGSVFRSEPFEQMLASRRVKHTLMRPCHPWTNGRIERLFRTLKETIFSCYWMLRSRSHVELVCSDFVTFYNGRPHSRSADERPMKSTPGVVSIRASSSALRSSKADFAGTASPNIGRRRGCWSRAL